MSESKHTPGPWRLHAEHLRGGLYHSVSRPGVDDTIDIHETDNGEADARLIAAAPDLLAFAHYVLEMDPSSNAPLFEQARAAIAKAEGR